MAESFHVISHDRVHLIAGLRWHALETPGRGTCRAWVKGADASHWLRLQGNGQDALVGYVQLGLSDLTTAQIRRAYSLAALIAPVLGQNGWGVFHLTDDRYWFVATTDGCLSPLSDIVGSVTDITRSLQRYLAYVSDAKTTAFCPDGFSPSHSGDTTPLTTLLASLPPGKTARLHPVSQRLPAVLWSAAAVIALVGYLGWQHYQDVQHKKEIAEARDAFLAAKKKVGDGTAGLARPWTQQPSPKSVIRACTDAWNVPLSVAGWLFRTAECADGQVRIAWHSPKGGNVADFRNRILHRYPNHTPFFNIPGAADLGGISLPVSVAPDKSGDELPTADEVMQRLTSYAQRLGITLSISENSPQATEVGGHTIPLPWRSWRFSMQTDIPVRQLFSQDINDSGIRLSGITATLASSRLHYQIQGTLYAKR